MRKSKRMWKGLFYDYHNRAYWDPDVRLRAPEVRRTTPEDTGNSTEGGWNRENQFIWKLELQEVADPELYWDWTVGPEWHSLQFRSGYALCVPGGSQAVFAYYTYEINHTHVQLMIRNFRELTLQKQIEAWFPTSLRVDRNDDAEFIKSNACRWYREYTPYLSKNIIIRLV